MGLYAFHDSAGVRRRRSSTRCAMTTRVSLRRPMRAPRSRAEPTSARTDRTYEVGKEVGQRAGVGGRPPTLPEEYYAVVTGVTLQDILTDSKVGEPWKHQGQQ